MSFGTSHKEKTNMRKKSKGVSTRETMWSGVVEAGGKRATLEEMLEAKRRTKEGKRPNAALVSLFDRVKRMEVEEPLRYDFPDERTAQNFAQACNMYRRMAKLEDAVHVGKAGCSVYVYRKGE